MKMDSVDQGFYYMWVCRPLHHNVLKLPKEISGPLWLYVLWIFLTNPSGHTDVAAMLKQHLSLMHTHSIYNIIEHVCVCLSVCRAIWKNQCQCRSWQSQVVDRQIKSFGRIKVSSKNLYKRMLCWKPKKIVKNVKKKFCKKKLPKNKFQQKKNKFC